MPQKSFFFVAEMGLIYTGPNYIKRQSESENFLTFMVHPTLHLHILILFEITGTLKRYVIVFLAHAEHFFVQGSKEVSPLNHPNQINKLSHLLEAHLMFQMANPNFQKWKLGLFWWQMIPAKDQGGQLAMPADVRNSISLIVLNQINVSVKISKCIFQNLQMHLSSRILGQPAMPADVRNSISLIVLHQIKR